MEINFENLKYNLYELLNVSDSFNINLIKKNYIKLIKKFHPDKNSELEEDIYYHIILAGQILLNNNTKQKYDDYILNKHNNHNELKNNFSNHINNIKKKENYIQDFNNKTNELNDLHGYNNFINNKLISDYDNYKNNRNNNSIIIENKEYKSLNDFNENFKINKLPNGNFHNQIIDYIGYPLEISNYINNNIYTNIEDINKLYVNDSVNTSIFSSLDNAFLLHPELDNIFNNLSVIDKFENEKKFR